MLLKLINVTVHYGSAEAVKDISLEVPEGAVVSVIGANGAGKSTILKAISRLIPLTSGQIWFRDREISNMEAHKIVRLGLVQIPEGRRLFPYMSVLANLKLGAFLRNDHKAIAKDLDNIFERFPVLRERRNQQAGTLSGGEQQMLAIGRSLMASPKLLLMDEPSIGLAPLMVEEVANAIRDINKSGISVLLVEQNAGLVTSVSEKGYVIEVGKVVLEGNLKELLAHDLVRRAFLGA
jgi:branched-chain amino acid transport system ATP-binding protein